MWFTVVVSETVSSGRELDEPPKPGSVLYVDGVLVRVDEVTTGSDGRPLILASRVTKDDR